MKKTRIQIKDIRPGDTLINVKYGNRTVTRVVRGRYYEQTGFLDLYDGDVLIATGHEDEKRNILR